MRRILAIGLLLLVAPAFSQTLTFTVETSTQGGTTVVPRLTWVTAPAGAQCTASALPAASDWTGTKNSSGTAVLAAINATRSYTMACNWPGTSTAVVSWTAPTTNTDGSAYTNPGGFRIQYGSTATELDTSAYIENPAARTWTSPPLAVGQWFFGVKAYNVHGLESDVSNVTSKTFTATSTQTRTLEVAVKFPSPPVATIQ